MSASPGDLLVFKTALLECITLLSKNSTSFLFTKSKTLTVAILDGESALIFGFNFNFILVYGGIVSEEFFDFCDSP